MVIKVDDSIYNGILEPLIVKVVNEVFRKQRLNIKNIVVNDKEEEDDEEISIIAPWIVFCKYINLYF